MFKLSIPEQSIIQACEQISVERLNESKYLNLEAYFSKYNLNGFKSLMRKQADGEAEHARKIIDMLDDRNAAYYIKTLPLEPINFTTLGEVLTFWLETEQLTTQELNKRAQEAWDVDPISREFWLDMLKEQQEEEKEPMYWITRAEIAGIMDLSLDIFDIGNPIEYIKRQHLIAFDNEAKS